MRAVGPNPELPYPTGRGRRGGVVEDDDEDAATEDADPRRCLPPGDEDVIFSIREAKPLEGDGEDDPAPVTPARPSAVAPSS